jgi:predicted DNA-binding protein (UPF0251 family)
VARPPIERTVSAMPRITLFKPAGVLAHELEHMRLGVDELEAIRLVDLEGMSHEQAAQAMGVSRQTVGRVLEQARSRVAEALVGGKAILIDGGQYRVEPRRLRCSSCRAAWTAAGEVPSAVCPECGSGEIDVCRRPGKRCAQSRGGAARSGRRQGRGESGGQGPGDGRGRHGQSRGHNQHGRGTGRGPQT